MGVIILFFFLPLLPKCMVFHGVFLSFDFFYILPIMVYVVVLVFWLHKRQFGIYPPRSICLFFRFRKLEASRKDEDYLLVSSPIVLKSERIS